MNFAGVQSITIPEGDVRSIAIGGVTVWQKPNPLPYDAEVDYVESDGTQYVDTGVAAAGDLRVIVDGQFLALDSTPGLFGTVASARFDLVINNSNRRWEPGYNTTYSSATVAADTNRHTFELTNAFTLDGSTLWTTTAATFTAEDMLVFALCRPAPNTVRNYARARLYSMKIWKADALVRDLAPVRVGTAGYLYDRANPTGGPLGNGLYGSATSTPLVAGPDKNGV